MPWSKWVSTPEAHARASGRRRHNKRRQQAVQVRRQEVQQLVERWGLSAAAKVKLARYFRVSLRTIARDLRTMQEDPVLPPLCPLCGLPTDLTADPSTLTDDPVELAAMETAMSRLIGMAEPETLPPRRTGSRAPRLKRPQGDDRLDPRAQTLGETARHA